MDLQYDKTLEIENWLLIIFMNSYSDQYLDFITPLHTTMFTWLYRSHYSCSVLGLTLPCVTLGISPRYIKCERKRPQETMVILTRTLTGAKLNASFSTFSLIRQNNEIYWKFRTKWFHIAFVHLNKIYLWFFSRILSPRVESYKNFRKL